MAAFFVLATFHKLMLTILISNATTLSAVHVGRRNKLNVAQLQDSSHNLKYITNFFSAQPKILKGFLKNRFYEEKIIGNLSNPIINKYVRHCQIMIPNKKLLESGYVLRCNPLL